MKVNINKDISEKYLANIDSRSFMKEYISCNDVNSAHCCLSYSKKCSSCIFRDKPQSFTKLSEEKRIVFEPNDLQDGFVVEVQRSDVVGFSELGKVVSYMDKGVIKKYVSCEHIHFPIDDIDEDFQYNNYYISEVYGYPTDISRCHKYDKKGRKLLYKKSSITIVEFKDLFDFLLEYEKLTIEFVFASFGITQHILDAMFSKKRFTVTTVLGDYCYLEGFPDRVHYKLLKEAKINIDKQ